MRALLIFSLLLICFSCNKIKPVAKKMGGTYSMKKILKDDGSVQVKNTDYYFEDAKSDGKTYSGWTAKEVGDTIEYSGQYCVISKGQFVVMKTNTANGIITDTARLEDIDKRSMVLRIRDGIYYFNKVIPK